MIKMSKNDVANYIINSPSIMFEDGCYYAHWSEDNGLNYDGNTDPENITVIAECQYADHISREEFDAKENINDFDFMAICEELAEKLNTEISKKIDF